MSSRDMEDAKGDGKLMDFSCYITINNRSDEDLGLTDFGINGRYGEWPDGMPLNTIDAHTSAEIQLKDPRIIGGSEGWVAYEVLNEQRPSFKLEFACPEAPWSPNYLRPRTYNRDVLSVTVKPYKEAGHPFYGHVDVDVKTERSEKLQRKLILGDTPENMANVKFQKPNDPPWTKYDIGFGGAKPLAFKQPLHETIAIAAFILSKKPLPKGTIYHNLSDKQWEYFRGIVWNDDPSCYLFKDYTKKNHIFSLGLAWLRDFKSGPPSCMIQRSHFGDLQFLHAMGGSIGEAPTETQRKILKWFAVMYKLACGNQGVSDTDQLKQVLGEWFNTTTTPTDQKSLRDLILASTPHYYLTNIQQRALGICLHIISDSYAIGHTQRRLKNPDSYRGRDKNGYMVFKPGKWGDWGAVVNFHCYKGQKGDLHAHYDGLGGSKLPVPKNLDSFNSIIGARNAIDGCKKLINFWADGTKWEDGVETFLETEIFAIDEYASPSNSEVDQSGPISLCHYYFTSQALDVQYQAGLRRKLNSLATRVFAASKGHARVGRFSVWMAVLPIVSILVFGIITTIVGPRVYKHS
ncbi:hypothetical protein F4859DRAFT_505114 [Xylaria cf. heliscus]|nr:hypothetical protein F4859DRAFT_505114 [Xylaria cf. heliscus]